MDLEKQTCSGSAQKDGVDHKQWFLGDFMPESTGLFDEIAEIKFGFHKKGEARTQADSVASSTHNTLQLLIYGKVKTSVGSSPEGTDQKSFILENEGDYSKWNANVYHWWEVLEDSLVISFRWRVKSP